jgi:hypothetical protein
LYDRLIDRGRDLIWQSADGSSVLAHALYQGYQDGNDLGNYCGDLGDGVSALQALGVLVEELVGEVLEHGLDLAKLLDLAFERDEAWFVHIGRHR